MKVPEIYASGFGHLLELDPGVIFRKCSGQRVGESFDSIFRQRSRLWSTPPDPKRQAAGNGRDDDDCDRPLQDAMMTDGHRGRGAGVGLQVSAERPVGRRGGWSLVSDVRLPQARPTGPTHTRERDWPVPDTRNLKPPPYLAVTFTLRMGIVAFASDISVMVLVTPEFSPINTFSRN